VTISFNLAPGTSLGYAVDQITAIEQNANLPATIATGFSGTAQVFQDSLRGQGVLILAAVFAAFVILASSTRASSIHHHHLRPAVRRHRRDPDLDAV